MNNTSTLSMYCYTISLNLRPVGGGGSFWRYLVFAYLFIHPAKFWPSVTSGQYWPEYWPERKKWLKYFRKYSLRASKRFFPRLSTPLSFGVEVCSFRPPPSQPTTRAKMAETATRVQVKGKNNLCFNRQIRGMKIRPQLSSFDKMQPVTVDQGWSLQNLSAPVLTLTKMVTFDWF